MTESRYNYFRRRLIRMTKILQSPYRNLLFHERYNFRSSFMLHPQIRTIAEDSEWYIFEVDGFEYYWPKEYDRTDLFGLYQETFSPPSCNPHAYEVGSTRINSGDWVIDAGACEGFFTRHSLLRGARVLIIEPVPRLAEALAQTFKIELKAGQVVILRGALGESAGKSSLIIPSEQIYCAKIDEEGTETVKIYTLDSLIEERIVPDVNFIKMDIEGAEVAAIKGASNLLRTHSPKLSIAVYHHLHNAMIIRNIILENQPVYEVTWRGIFFRKDYGPARPYILHARAKT